MNWARKLMYGRYGGDQLSLFLIGLYIALSLLAALFRAGFLSWLALVPLAWGALRALSRNLDRRRGENARFLELTRPTLQWVKLRLAIRRDKEHRYFKCPKCGQQLRVPRGKGRIQIICRSCGVSFEENS